MPLVANDRDLLVLAAADGLASMPFSADFTSKGAIRCDGASEHRAQFGRDIRIYGGGNLSFW